MGFYYQNNYSNLLNVVTEASYNEGIEIVNNEEVTIDLTNFGIVTETGYISLENAQGLLSDQNNENILAENIFSRVEDSLYKIEIDYKDGTVDFASKPINKDINWTTFKHTFKFKDNTYIGTNNNPYPGTIDITLFNLYGFEILIKIPFRLKFESTQNQGIELKLVAANISNTGEISYIFNNTNKNQVFLARYSQDS